jgi:energy-coupling factor transport system permease protein
MFHTWAWVVWLAAAAVPAFVVRNPLYLVLILGASWIVYSALGRTSPIGSSWGSFAKIGLFFLALTIPFHALSNHLGEIVLFRLPANWPIVGGSITLEAAIAGTVNGLSLLTILMVFAAFDAVVDHYQLLRATPSFLFQAGVVVSIAITFVPQMVLSAKEIRQAQRIRGHRFRGIRDLLPLVLPLLASGLERAIQLAETLEARGFAGAAAPISSRRTMLARLGTLAGLLALLVGLSLAAYLPDWKTGGWALSILGAGGLLAMFRLEGRHIRRTRYRRTRWQARDTALVLGSALALAGVVAARIASPEMLVYSPFPPYSLLPPFQPLVAAGLLLLVLPAILAQSTVQRDAGVPPAPNGGSPIQAESTTHDHV